MNTNGGVNGAAGTITVSTQGTGHNVTLTQTTATALGGIADGDGNTITIKSDAGVSITGGQINASARGIGSGGEIDINGGTTTESVFLSTKINSNAGISGDGGIINISAGGATGGSGSINIVGDIHADGSGVGNGGHITIAAPSVTFTKSQLTANAGIAGNGGSILSFFTLCRMNFTNLFGIQS